MVARMNNPGYPTNEELRDSDASGSTDARRIMKGCAHGCADESSGLPYFVRHSSSEGEQKLGE
jgi:hypothetical protein